LAPILDLKLPCIPLYLLSLRMILHERILRSRLYDTNAEMSTNYPEQERTPRSWKLLSLILLLNLIPTVSAYTTNPFFKRNAGPLPRPARWGPPTKRDASIPLIISNLCESTIWPGIGTQAGTGAGTGGFALDPGTSRNLTVSVDWQGRIWGRTNCSFNVGGSGPSQLNGVNGNGASCATGDCGGVLDCVNTVSPPLPLPKAVLKYIGSHTCHFG
jgi:hypothetical protein